MYLQERIDFIESEIQEITKNAQNLKTDYLALIELKLLIEKTQTFFQDHSAHRKISASVQIYNNEGALGHLGFIAGVVTTSRVPSFERMLWRISHGNIFFKQAQIDEPLKDPVTVSRFFHLLKGSFLYDRSLWTTATPEASHPLCRPYPRSLVTLLPQEHNTS